MVSTKDLLIHNDEQFKANNEFAMDVERGLNDKEIGTRLTCQYDFDSKMRRISKSILESGYGNLEVFESDNNSNSKEVENIINKIYLYRNG